ncbi:MAG: CofD-related protein of GAK system, partial [Myxococcota bacterium]
DSGGSSAVLREAFGMLAVGDLRNRLMALADETALGNPANYALFAHRLPKHGRELRAELAEMVDGEHSLMRPIRRPMRRIIRTHLRVFLEHAPTNFDLRGASIGNLLLTAGYLHNDSDIDSVVYLFSQLVEARGTVVPTVDANLHLAADLVDGTRITGQHCFTGKEMEPPSQRIVRLSLVEGLSDTDPPARVSIAGKTRRLIESADLVVFPYGSFWSSILANLLPDGVGRAIAKVDCPKIYVPNTRTDPEQRDMTLGDSVEALLDTVRQDAGAHVPSERIITAVILDTNDDSYSMTLDIERVEALGVPVVRTPLVADGNVDPQSFVYLLVSLA